MSFPLLVSAASNMEPIVVPPPAPVLSEEDEHLNSILKYMFQYSFSQKLHQNFYVTGMAFQALNYVREIMRKKPFELTMRNILKFLSKVFLFNILSNNRKTEELLVFEAIVVLAYMKTPMAENVPLSTEDFEKKYPQFCEASVTAAEKEKLFEFCNCIRMIIRLIPAKNNKEHILDLAARLTDGFTVRYITGTGMTNETRRRYEIIHVEGQLTRISRPERRVDPSTKPPKEPKKRGRPLTFRV